ncbi:DUF6252 family protein [Flavobacterium poyangense]|uniref:DUF6252 family protein n=1 Tax=Flavobacterium poyangense TaxID=2204302 RepID=UPI0014216090|nr:DUF6252 family protein [Flavobacterium sp. JXAS1]
MKTTKVLFLFLVLILNSCSSDNSNILENTETSENTKPTSKYAMTAKIDGTLWQMNNAFNSNFATKPLFTYYPATEYIQLGGRNNMINEIRLMIKRSDLKVGTYPITRSTFDASKTQIDMSIHSKENLQYPVEGTLSITSVDLTTKTVAGTFSFNCVEDFSEPISATNPITTKVTEGTFNYRYDVSY